MRANEFVKKYGWDEAIKQIKNPTGTHGASFDYSFMGDLKRLVESNELVERFGGLKKAKNRLQKARLDFCLLVSFKNENNEILAVYDHVLEKAISDVESCQ